MQIVCLRRPRFQPPVFIDLPSKYDDVFHLYNEYRCEYCHKVSSDTLLCLICGEVHLARWQPGCCTQQRQRYGQVGAARMLGRVWKHDRLQHLAKCGHPAAVMLDIQTTLIVVSLPNVYGHWHSLYLDQHGEEDPKLK